MRTRAITTLAAVVAAGALVVLTAAPAQAHGYAPPVGNVVQVAIAASGNADAGKADSNPYDYDLLVAAVVKADLVTTLSGPGPFTVFAPNDRAFLRTFAELGLPAADESQGLATLDVLQSKGLLSTILLGHVVAGRALGPISVLLAGRITMANDSVIRPRFLTLRDENPNRTDPRLVLSAINIRATNGVIHTIDRVLLPAGV